MSDDFHRPTYTSELPNSAYNATQVRLYGIALPPWGPQSDGTTLSNTINMPSSSITMQNKATSDKTIEEELAGNVSALAQLDQLEKSTGLDLKKAQAGSQILYHIPIQTKGMGLVVLMSSVDVAGAAKSDCLSPGIIFGYAYEGHCYDMPKPKIMLIPDMPRTIPVDDCGYDLKAGNDYRLWITDKLDQCVEIDVSQGFIEQLVLEANLPGKRSPTMYGGRMLMGHRSGRLSE